MRWVNSLARRRFEVRGEYKGVTGRHYAYHPTETRAALAGAKALSQPSMAVGSFTRIRARNLF